MYTMLYDLNSKSRYQVYQAYGAVLMARQLNAISSAEFSRLSTMLVRDGLDNPQWSNTVD